MKTVVLCAILSLGGVVAGALAGRYLAHNAPLFGGINMMGKPGSPARSALVPGHAALLGSLGGIAGLVAGAAISFTTDKRGSATNATALLLCLATMAGCGSRGPNPSNAEQKLAAAWVNENEGDPSSINWIDLDGPRLLQGRPAVRVKYRAIGPSGGPIVHEDFVLVENGKATGTFPYPHHITWDKLPPPI